MTESVVPKIEPVGDRSVRSFKKKLVLRLFCVRTVSSKWPIRLCSLFERLALFVNFGIRFGHFLFRVRWTLRQGPCLYERSDANNQGSSRLTEELLWFNFIFNCKIYLWVHFFNVRGPVPSILVHSIHLKLLILVKYWTNINTMKHQILRKSMPSHYEYEFWPRFKFLFHF